MHKREADGIAIPHEPINPIAVTARASSPVRDRFPEVISAHAPPMRPQIKELANGKQMRDHILPAICRKHNTDSDHANPTTGIGPSNQHMGFHGIPAIFGRAQG
ncbi:hypothetical protein [Labrys miyagiensis]